MALDKGTRGRDRAAARKEQREAKRHVRQRQAAARPVVGETAAGKVPPRAPVVPVRPVPDAADVDRNRGRIRFEQGRNEEIKRQYGVGGPKPGVSYQGDATALTHLATGIDPDFVWWSVTHPVDRIRNRLPERYVSRDENGLQVNAGTVTGPGGFFARHAAQKAREAERVADVVVPSEGLPPLEERIGSSLEDLALGEQQQAAVTSAERGRRINAASDAYASAGGGEAGRRAALTELSGEIPKIRLGAWDNITPDELDRVNDYIKNHPDFQGYKWVQGQQAVQRVLSGQTPRKFEVKLLDELFGPEKVAEIAKDADLSARLKGFVGSAWNLPRAVKSSLDVSGGLRQGALVAASHPRVWRQAWGPSMRATKYLTPAQREARAAQEAAELMRRPNFERMQEGGVALAGIGKTAREEAFASNFSDHIPLVGHSGQQYTVFLNRLRADFFDHLINEGRKLGHNIDDPEFLRQTGKIVNEMTGRGSLEGYEGAVKLLSGMFFSPRLMASRVKFLGRGFHPYTWTGGRGPKANPAKRLARREARRAMTTFISSGMGILTLASQMPGVEVGLDPRSADFGKIKVGDTRVDIWSGFQPYIVAAARMYTGQKVLSTTGEVQDLEKYGSGRVTGSMSNFFENKFAPQVSYLWQWDKAGKATGREFDPLSEAGKLLLPIGVEGAYDTTKDYGPGRAAAEFGASFVGFGAQTYGSGPAKAEAPKTRVGKLAAAVKEEEGVARKLGAQVPAEVKKALTLQSRLTDAVDHLYAEQKGRDDVVTPDGKRFKLTERQKAAAELRVLVTLPEVRPHAERLNQILAGLKTEAQIEEFRNELKGELGLGVLRQWHEETADALEELALAAAS